MNRSTTRSGVWRLRKATVTEAYFQGDLDSLCGLYALVNAINWGLRKDAPLSSREVKALMRAMILHLDRTGDLADTLTRGLNAPALNRLSDVAGAWLNARRNVSLGIGRPFSSTDSAVPVHSVTEKLNAHLKADQTAAIILIRRQVQHWTVVTSISASNFILKDSEGIHRIPISACTCRRIADQSKGMVRLVPRGFFLLTFTREN